MTMYCQPCLFINLQLISCHSKLSPGDGFLSTAVNLFIYHMHAELVCFPSADRYRTDVNPVHWYLDWVIVYVY